MVMSHNSIAFLTLGPLHFSCNKIMDHRFRLSLVHNEMKPLWSALVYIQDLLRSKSSHRTRTVIRFLAGQD